MVSVLAWQAPIALAVARPRSPLRDAGIYALQMWAYIAHYEMPNDDPERLRARLHVTYPIRADTVLGAGTVPTLRLQRALGTPGQVRRHDLALAWVHWSWFFVPHGASAYILVKHRWHFPRAAAHDGRRLRPRPARLLGGAHRAAMVGGSERQHAARAQDHGGSWGALLGSRSGVRSTISSAGNPFAAMPSLHFGTSVMAAHVLSDVGRLPGALGWAYAGTLGFALVYLGEHYVVDLVAGFALAEGVRRARAGREPRRPRRWRDRSSRTRAAAPRDRQERERRRGASTRTRRSEPRKSGGGRGLEHEPARACCGDRKRIAHRAGGSCC